MLRAAVRPEAQDFTLEAAEALQACWATFDSEDRLTWATDAFRRRLPELKPGRPAPPDAVAGLEEALACVRAAPPGERITALLTRQADRRAYDAVLARRSGRIHLALEDAAERQEALQRRLADRERLILTSRVLSVGEMAAMLAHELNQPIGSIANLVRGLKLRLDRGALEPQTAAQALEKASEQALYASGVIQRIRTFVEARQPRAEPLDLARLARCTFDLLDWEIDRDRVDAVVDLPPDLPLVLGDEVMIQQVLVNLARNALDAMRAEPGERRLLLSGYRDGDRVELRIRDSGPGVSDEAATRLFSPFYSSKADGMGVGLGVCRSIVELHAGRLWFTRNSDGPGSTFHLALPASSRRATTEEAA